MIGLTNEVGKLTEKEVNELVEKYKNISDTLDAKDLVEVVTLLYCINIAVKHIKEKHNTLNIDWKTWVVVLIKKMFHKKKLNTVDIITTSIDEFYKHYDENYNEYKENQFAVDEYWLNNGFVNAFIKNLET